MKSRLAALAGFLAATTLPAAAADYWQDHSFELRPAIHDWTGAYAGIHAGWGWGEHSAKIFGFDLGSLDTDGLVVGLQAGYRSQDSGFVWGLEADVSYFDHGVRDQGFLFGFPYDARADMNWVGSLRLVAGVPLDNVLLYATGGLAASRLTAEETITGISHISHKKHLWGWTGGVGGEFALSPAWSARGEWLYYDFGKTDHRIVGIPVTTEHNFHVVRAGLNYRFD